MLSRTRGTKQKAFWHGSHSRGEGLANGLGQRLGDENSIQGGTAQQLVAAHEKLEPVVTENDALADAAYVDSILGRRAQRHGVLLLRWVIHHLNAWSRGQKAANFVGVHGLLSFDDNGLGVCAQGRNAHGRARHLRLLARITGRR